MSRIVGGGGGLTIDEIKTALKVGEAGGVPITNSAGALMVAGDYINLKSGQSNPSSIAIKSGSESLIQASWESAGTYPLFYLHNGVSTRVLGEPDRNGATANAVAGIYNPCKTLLNEHRPVCTKEYHLVGKHLDGAENPDVWFAIPGAGGGTVVYSSRFLTLTSGTGATSATRCVIDQTKFPITGNFIEVTCRIGTLEKGEGGYRDIALGFAPAFSSFPNTDRATFYATRNGIWYLAYKGGQVALTDTSLGRNLVAGDICTVRLDRREGSPNIDIARFYVNGQKQYETTNIPTVDCYAGIGIFTDANVTTAMNISIDYFGVRYVP